MDPQRLRQIEELYHSARERPPEARAALLGEADPELRREVESLLAQDALPGPMESPAVGLLEHSTLTHLAVGAQLGPYRIEGLLGAGGMGQVYRATDTRLGRQVAIKTSAEHFSDRFEREARAIAALNHPNICTLYDVGPDYLVMELVEGETLAKRLKKGALPAEQALRFGIEIAGALAEAHARGIVHRDLKPGNIMITRPASGPAGVKVLDFGLAKMAEEPGDTLTATRQVMGTPAYMAPEQREGQPCDWRADIYALGLILYEMSTGKRLASGQVAAVEDLPDHLWHGIISKCLENDRELRCQHAAEIRTDLQRLKRDTGHPIGPARVTTSGKPGATTHAAKRWRLMAPWWVAIALLAVGMAGAWWWKARSGESPPELSMRQLTADSGLTTDPALSRDGKLVAYASDRATHKNLNIWIHPLTEGAQPIRLTTGDADDDSPDFSPDGGLIVFHSNRDGGGIYLVPTFGGEERLLVRGGRFPRFAPDGKRVAYCLRRSGTAFLEQSSIYTVPVTGGEAKRLATDVPWASTPVFSRDGRHILFEGAIAVNDVASHDWWVTPAGGGQSVRTGASAALAELKMAHMPSACDWSGDQVLFTSGGQVWGLRLSAPGWRPGGPARRLTSGSNTLSLARASNASLLVFGSAQFFQHMWKLRLDSRSGKVLGEMEPLSHSGGSQCYPSSSADGRLLAYRQGEPGGSYIRLRDLPAGKEITLLNGPGRPKVSPDGSQVAYSVFPDSVYVMPSSGGESALLISSQGKSSKSSRQIYGWTPDGKKIVYWWGKPTRFGLLDPQTGQSTGLVAHSRYDVHGAELSPDQRWVAFNMKISARQEPLSIAAWRDGRVADEKDWIRVSMEGDERPWWSSDGNLLYLVSRRDGDQCIWAQRLDPVTKRPVGGAFAVYHLHGTRKVYSENLACFGPAILPDGMIFSLEEGTGNVWIGERKQ